MKINLSLKKIYTSNVFHRKYKARVRKNFHRSSSFTDQSNLILSQTFKIFPKKKNLHFPTTSIRVSNLISPIHIISTYIPVSISRQLASSFVHRRPPLAPIFTRQNKQPPTEILSSIGFFLHQRRLFRPFPSKLSYYFY